MSYKGYLAYRPNLAKSMAGFICRLFLRPSVYIGLMFSITAACTYACAGLLVFEPGNRCMPFLWLCGFGFLLFNVAYCLITSLYALFLRPQILPEINLSDPGCEAATPIPRVAILYPVLNERVGLYERMAYSLSGNALDGDADIWVLSDSPLDAEQLAYESDVVERLRERFGKDRIHYWRRKQPVERKQGNIKGWLDHHGKDYPFFIVCDADTMLGPGMLQKLLAKALHPTNRQFAVFQSRLHVAHDRTYFAKFEASSMPIVQRLYVAVNQRVFGQAMYFGHAALIRSAVFARIQLPAGISSHDIWESALLDRMGYKVAFCYDTLCFEEVPAHYLEMRSRERRWAKGNLQTFPIITMRGLSLPMRFYTFYGLYMYICQPVFLCWMLLGFFGASLLGGKLLSFQRYAFLGASVIDLELTSMLTGVLLVVFLHRLVAVRSWAQARDVLLQTLLSTALCLNNVLYATLDMIALAFRKAGGGWVPMRKDPDARLALADAARHLWPSTALGVLGIWAGWAWSPLWLSAAAIFLISFTLAIPIAYVTALPVGGRLPAWSWKAMQRA